MKPEVEQNMDYFEGADMTLEQKEEFIHTMWLIMDHFVDQTFDSQIFALSCLRS